MHETTSAIQKALLVGVQLPSLSEFEVNASLEELARLVTTLGYLPVAKTFQKRKSEKNKSVLGEGKLKEIAKLTGGSGVIAASFVKKKTKAALRFEGSTTSDIDESDDDAIDGEDLDDDLSDASDDGNSVNEKIIILNADELHSKKALKADVVIFDCELTPSQLRNLESAFGCDVLDRTGVIIEIFSRHAKTRSARLQVEIAKLTYVAPRLRETGGASERQGGGVGGRGAGETSLELDRRKIRDRIKELKKELQSIDNEHLTRRARRDQEIKVALVGYTNAGKSSLMRAMTGSEVFVADKLFATLDTTIRPMHPESIPKILFSDTVGFIKKLPHDLVASFKSTLDEALNATLLLFVVDSSDPSFRDQLVVTKSVLAEVGVVDDTPHLLVLNKIDRLTLSQIEELRLEFPEGIFISTRSKDDLDRLREILLKRFEAGMIDANILVSYAVKGAVGEIRQRLRVLSESHSENGFVFSVRGTEKDINQIKSKFKLQ